MSMEVCSFTRLSADGVVGVSGKAVDVTAFTIQSGAAAGVLTFRNGTSATDAVAFTQTGPATTVEQIYTFSVPVRLSSGCFADFDANVAAATVFYIQAVS